MAYNLTSEQLKLVDEYRKYMNNESTRQAFDALVGCAKADPLFDFVPTGHGNISRTVKYVRKEDGAWAYGFIVNRGSILFYYRIPSRRVTDALVKQVVARGLEASLSSLGEIKVRLCTADDAQVVIADCFPAASVMTLPSLRDLNVQFQARIASALQCSSAERAARLAEASRDPQKVQVTTYAFVRNPYVVAEVLLRAIGNCEECKSAAPFARRKDGTPYLEVHHRTPLSEGGEDSVENAMAVCPNCHREKHYG